MVQNGVPFDVAHEMSELMGLAYTVMFVKLKNGDKEFDWDRMKFIDRR